MANENSYGYFGKELGAYTITELPKIGLYEYIYKNGEVLLKLDQFGFQTAQIDPPVGEALFKREKRGAVYARIEHGGIFSHLIKQVGQKLAHQVLRGVLLYFYKSRRL